MLLEHSVRYPADHKPSPWGAFPDYTFVDDQLLVTWESDSGRFGYWSSRPTQVFGLGRNEVRQEDGLGIPSLELPGVGRILGGRAVRAGDTSVRISAVPVISDGSHAWCLERSASTSLWREMDPATGCRGPAT